MFNRSLKYIFLLLINILLLFVLYFNQETEQDGVFDTQFVIGLLEERDRLQNALIDAEMAQVNAEKSLRQVESQLGASDASSQNAKQLYLRCESDRLDAERIVKEQSAQLELAMTPIAGANCEEQSAKLNLARQRLASAQVDVERYQDTIANLENRLAQASEQDDVTELVEQIEALQLENLQLKADSTILFI